MYTGYLPLALMCAIKKVVIVAVIHIACTCTCTCTNEWKWFIRFVVLLEHSVIKRVMGWYKLSLKVSSPLVQLSSNTTWQLCCFIFCWLGASILALHRLCNLSCKCRFESEDAISQVHSIFNSLLHITCKFKEVCYAIPKIIFPGEELILR